MSRNYKFHNPEEYVYSSAVDYAGQKGFIDDVLVFRMLNYPLMPLVCAPAKLYLVASEIGKSRSRHAIAW